MVQQVQIYYCELRSYKLCLMKIGTTSPICTELPDVLYCNTTDWIRRLIATEGRDTTRISTTHFVLSNRQYEPTFLRQKNHHHAAQRCCECGESRDGGGKENGGEWWTAARNGDGPGREEGGAVRALEFRQRQHRSGSLQNPLPLLVAATVRGPLAAQQAQLTCIWNLCSCRQSRTAQPTPILSSATQRSPVSGAPEQLQLVAGGIRGR